MFTTYSYGHPRKSTIKLLEKYIPNDKKRSQKITVMLASKPKEFHKKRSKRRSMQPLGMGVVWSGQRPRVITLFIRTGKLLIIQ